MRILFVVIAKGSFFQLHRSSARGLNRAIIYFQVDGSWHKQSQAAAGFNHSWPHPFLNVDPFFGAQVFYVEAQSLLCFGLIIVVGRRFAVIQDFLLGILFSSCCSLL